MIKVDKVLHVTAKITGIKYSPLLCRKLHTFDLERLDEALSSESTFLLKIDERNKVAISWWVSAKRTRSYPYARVYDSLSYSGKKVTIIPIIKDEGKSGDRDFLQFDTVSLMSLLSVFVIISYYKDAEKNLEYHDKITNQRYDISFIKTELKKLLSYRSSALHWNLAQLEGAGKMAEIALNEYSKISKRLSIKMHSADTARKRIKSLKNGKESFLRTSRDLARKAQERESITEQPKEKLKGTKGTITITNYLGGKYFFTSDEIEIYGNNLFLIEGKHTKTNKLPSLGDIKDGLLRMILFSNLNDTRILDKVFNPIPVLKLTTGIRFTLDSMKRSQRILFANLLKEAETNNFRVLLNSEYQKADMVRESL